MYSLLKKQAIHQTQILFLLAFLILSPIFIPSNSYADSATAETIWQPIAKGIELGRIRLYPDALFSPEVLITKINLNFYRITPVRSRDFGEKLNNAYNLSVKSKALAGINANFFDVRGDELGLVMSRGIIQHPLHKGGKTLTGIFQVSRKGPRIVSRDTFQPDYAVEAVQAGPRLIDDFQVISGQKDSEVSSRRAGICVHDSQHVSFYISSGFIGLTINQLQDLLTNPQIKCREALNLDGGGSAQFFLSAQLPEAIPDLQEIVIHGRDQIPVMLGVFLKREI